MTYAAPDASLVTPLVISAVSSPWSALGTFRAASATAGAASATGPTTGNAVHCPFVVTTVATFRRGFWINGTTPAGSVCVGIYDENQNRQATTGNVVASGASVLQSAAFAASTTLAPGQYYMSISFSSGAGANQIFGFATALAYRGAGLYVQSSANPLPDPAVFATWATEQICVFGITQTSFAI